MTLHHPAPWMFLQEIRWLLKTMPGKYWFAMMPWSFKKNKSMESMTYDGIYNRVVVKLHQNFEQVQLWISWLAFCSLIFILPWRFVHNVFVLIGCCGYSLHSLTICLNVMLQACATPEYHLRIRGESFILNSMYLTSELTDDKRQSSNLLAAMFTKDSSVD